MRLKYYFSFKRIRSFTIHLLKKALRKLGETDYSPEKHEIEQFMYRYLTCPDCLAQGHCKEPCKCLMPERMHVMTDHCPAKLWNKMKNKKNWEKTF